MLPRRRLELWRRPGVLEASGASGRGQTCSDFKSLTLTLAIVERKSTSSHGHGQLIPQPAAMQIAQLARAIYYGSSQIARSAA